LTSLLVERFKLKLQNLNGLLGQVTSAANMFMKEKRFHIYQFLCCFYLLL